MTVELIQGLLLAFAIVVILMPPYIRLLRATGFTKQIRIEGPDSHQVKHGTPTMGGVLLIAVVLALYLLLRWPPEGGIFAPLAALAGVGLLGAFDDYLNAKTGEVIRVRQKLAWQIVVAFVAAWQIQRTYNIDQIAVPFVGPVGIAPLVFVLFAAFAIIAASNGVNITDGLDGLAGGTLVFAFVAYLLIALLNEPTQPNLASLCALIIGALLGFLWFNDPNYFFAHQLLGAALGGFGLVVAANSAQWRDHVLILDRHCRLPLVAGDHAPVASCTDCRMHAHSRASPSRLRRPLACRRSGPFCRRHHCRRFGPGTDRTAGARSSAR